MTHLPREGGTSTPSHAASRSVQPARAWSARRLPLPPRPAPAPAEHRAGGAGDRAAGATVSAPRARRSPACARGRPRGGARPSRSPRSPSSGSRCGSSQLGDEAAPPRREPARVVRVAARRRGTATATTRSTTGRCSSTSSRSPTSLFGAGDYVARIPSALDGHDRGLPARSSSAASSARVAALTASVALCLAPSFLYFSRFAREDIHVATVTLGLIVVLLRFFDQPRPWHPDRVLGLLAVSFATKETTYITVFVVGSFLAAAVVVQAVGRGARRGAARRRARPRRRLARAAPRGHGASSTFLVVYTLLFSTFLTNPSGLQEGLVRQHRLLARPAGRQPRRAALVLLPGPDPGVRVADRASSARRDRASCCGGRRCSALFLVWMFVGSLAVYSWASERMPWLVLHPLLPLVLLAGIGAQALWESRARLSASWRWRSSASRRSARCTRRSGSRTSARRMRASCSSRCRRPTTSPAIRDELVRLQAACDARERGAVRAHGRQLGRNRLAVELVPPRRAERLLRHEHARSRSSSAASSSSPTRTTRR